MAALRAGQKRVEVWVDLSLWEQVKALDVSVARVVRSALEREVSGRGDRSSPGAAGGGVAAGDGVGPGGVGGGAAAPVGAAVGEVIVAGDGSTAAIVVDAARLPGGRHLHRMSDVEVVRYEQGKPVHLRRCDCGFEQVG